MPRDGDYVSTLTEPEIQAVLDDATGHALDGWASGACAIAVCDALRSAKREVATVLDLREFGRLMVESPGVLWPDKARRPALTVEALAGFDHGRNGGWDCKPLVAGLRVFKDIPGEEPREVANG